MFKLFTTICQHVLAIILPPTCPGCRAHLSATEPLGFCGLCYGTMPWWNTARLLPPPLPAAITSFTSPCLYDGPLRTAILDFKFHDAIPYARPLAKLLHPHLQQFTGLPNVLLVPVPSHSSRLRKRRYNHAALLVKELTRLTDIPYNVTSLKRIRRSSPQAHKTRAARLKLPATAFSSLPRPSPEKPSSSSTTSTPPAPPPAPAPSHYAAQAPLSSTSSHSPTPLRNNPRRRLST